MVRIARSRARPTRLSAGRMGHAAGARMGKFAPLVAQRSGGLRRCELPAPGVDPETCDHDTTVDTPSRYSDLPAAELRAPDRIQAPGSIRLPDHFFSRRRRRRIIGDHRQRQRPRSRQPSSLDQRAPARRCAVMRSGVAQHRSSAAAPSAGDGFFATSCGARDPTRSWAFLRSAASPSIGAPRRRHAAVLVSAIRRRLRSRSTRRAAASHRATVLSMVARPCASARLQASRTSKPPSRRADGVVGSTSMTIDHLIDIAIF